MACQSFCLKWDGYHTNMTGLIESLRQADELVDITLCCQGQKIRAHRIILSVCSPYFRDVLKDNVCQHMVFYMRDTSASDLAALVEFMYSGRVNVPQNQLGSFIKTAEALQIRGLCGDDDKNRPASQPHQPSPPLHRQPSKNYRPHSPLTSSSPQQPTQHRHSPPSSSPVHVSAGFSSAKRRRRPSDTSLDTGAAISKQAHKQQRIDVPDTGDHLETGAEDQKGSLPAATGGSPGTTQPEVAGGSANHTIASTSFPPASSAPSSATAGEGDGDGEEYDSERAESDAVDVQFDSSVKIEKVDLTEDGEEESSLEATLGQVAEFEGFEGLSHSTMEAGDYASHLTMSEYANTSLGALDASSSSVLGEEGQSQGVGSFVCRVCGASYGSSVALSLHMPKHRGLTTCPLCGLVSSRVSNLRSHLVRVHHLSEAEMECFVPRRNTWAQTAQRAAFSESSATSGFQQQQHQHSQASSHRDLL